MLVRGGRKKDFALMRGRDGPRGDIIATFGTLTKGESGAFYPWKNGEIVERVLEKKGHRVEV